MSPPPHSPRSAYIHVPFCARRCGYCNFTLVAGRDDLIGAYLQALEFELAGLDQPRPVETLFLGGGTPTHLKPRELERLLELVISWHPLLPGAEFSIEANPQDITGDCVAVLAAHGVTRISLGGQSFQPEKLRTLDRDHQGNDVIAAIELARPRIGSISLDLIFGAPGETLAGWEEDLEAAMSLPIDHVSTYGLTIEPGTSFWSRRLRGTLCEPQDDLQLAMYEAGIERLTAAGMEHYEVSNFARPGHRCRHNEVYWTGESYYAAGPGAARHIDGLRETNHRSTTTYLKRVLAHESPVAERERLSPEQRAREVFVFGMRRLQGVERESFAMRTGYALDELFGPQLAKHTQLELIEDDGRRIRLTRRGLLVSDSLWPEYL